MHFNIAKIIVAMLSLFFCTTLSFAAVVTQVKNGKVLIDAQNDDLEIDQQYFLLNSAKAKVGIILITSIKGDKAVASILKGKSDGTENLLAKDDDFDKEKNQVSGTGASSTEASGTYRLTTKKIAGLLGIMSNTMSAKEADAQAPTPNRDDVSMQGTSIAIAGTLDYPIYPWITAHMALGYEPFSAEGTSSIKGCAELTSYDCNVSISYLSVGAYARFDIYKSRIIYWAGLGAASKFPIVKNGTAFRSNDLKLTAAYGVMAGLEYFLNYKLFIPLTLQQEFFMSSDTVKASQLSVRGGLGLAY